jgi:hypothetical protein
MFGGGSKQFRVKKADFSTSSLDGLYAQLHREELPRTISDAMFVVESIGEKYLWVDSLCILEDGESEMKAMVHAMDSVYKNASLTIIAACGEDSNAGLPGLHPGSRTAKYVTGSVDGVHIVSIENNLTTILDNSTWGYRGWTYQEYEFSDEALIFVNQHVYFESRGLVWSESNPNRCIYDKVGARGYSLKPTHSFFHYDKHVSAYTNRSLTFEDDILSAFTAILQDHSARFATNFCWGLPIQHFQEALMWKCRQ